MWLDSKLMFKPHVKQVIRNVKAALQMISELGQEALKMLKGLPKLLQLLKREAESWGSYEIRETVRAIPR